MIKLVAFDWNGTLFADTNAVFECNNDNFKFLKVNPPSLNYFRKYYEVPIKNFYLSLGASETEFDKNTKKIAEAFHSCYEKRVSKTRTRAYARDLLKLLQGNNIRSVIFSNHTIDSIINHTKRLKIEKYFLDIIANTDMESPLKGINKKENLNKYLNKHSILPDETIIIGDTVEEINIGSQLGVISVAITHGNVSTPRLRAAKPDYLISSLKEVIKIIQKINQLAG